MTNHFNLSKQEFHNNDFLCKQEFHNNDFLFSTLEITGEQVIGKNYQDLSDLLKKQFKKLSLKAHPDKGGDRYRFNEIKESYDKLEKYIKPLKSGGYCNVSYAQGTGYLTLREFNYRKQLFEKYHITEEEVVNKDYQTILNILNKNSEYEQDIRDYHKMIIEVMNDLTSGKAFEDILPFVKKLEVYKAYSKKPSIRLFNYVNPLSRKESLIFKDQQQLSLQLLIQKLKVYTEVYPRLAGYYVSYMLLNNIVVFCYFSWTLDIVFNIISLIGITWLVIHKFKNLKEYDSLISKRDYIFLGAYVYLLAAFSAYLLASSFIVHGLTIGIVILGSLFMWNTFIIAYNHVLLNGCQTYINKSAGLLGSYISLFDIICLLEKEVQPEQSRLQIDKLLQYIRDCIKQQSKVINEDDLQLFVDQLENILQYDLLECSQLKQYDPRRLLMPVIMPFVKKYFAEFESELAERDFNEVNTNMCDVHIDQSILAIQFLDRVGVRV